MTGSNPVDSFIPPVKSSAPKKQMGGRTHFAMTDSEIEETATRLGLDLDDLDGEERTRA